MNLTPNTNKTFVSSKFLRLLKRYFFKKLDIKPARNSRYKEAQLFRTICYLATQQLSAEQGVELLKLELPNELVPSADTILRRIKELSLTQLQSIFAKALAKTVREAKHLFFGKVWLAIDYHDIPFFGNINNPFIVGTQRKLGTNYAYRFATIEVVEESKRLCIGCIPVRCEDEKAQAITTLVRQAKKTVKIASILLDRGFYSLECIGALKRLGTKFIMPVPKNKRVKKTMKELRFKLPTVTHYEMGSGSRTETFNLCLRWAEKKGDKPDEVQGFATNIPVESKEDVEWIAKQYGKRWSIETGYRMKKDFRARTTSKSNVVRQLYFFLSVLLFNTWILYKIVIGHITAKVFKYTFRTSFIIRENYFAT